MKKAGFLILIILISTSILAQTTEQNQINELRAKMNELTNDISSLKKIKISGLIQTQYQYGDKDASLKVGAKNENLQESFNRIGIRRGRLKFTYENGLTTGVFQFDATEKGISLKDLYVNLKDPFFESNAVRAGVFIRPFGFELGYSSSLRESPERSTIIQTLFPDERDLGMMLVLQAPKRSDLNFIKLEGGVFAGNGLKLDNHNCKDFIGHLSLNPKIKSNMIVGLGASYYGGGVYQGTKNVYTMYGNEFVLNDDEANLGKYAKRQYWGFDSQFGIKSRIGRTEIRAEYLLGQQPGNANLTKSPNSSLSSSANGDRPDYDTYIRSFNGGYVLLTHSFWKLPLRAVVKYDWYDPNTKVAGNEIGLNGTTYGDLAQSTIGFGAILNISRNLLFHANYEINKYENTENAKVNDRVEVKDYKGNVFTLRMQYAF